MKNVITKACFILYLFSFYSYQLLPTTVGSDSAVSLQGSVEFRESDSNNIMKGFAAFEAGFSLETPSTTCTFDSFFPVSGTVDMKCGTLRLLKDLIFNSETSLDNMGNIDGNGHAVRLSESVTTLTAFSEATAASALFAQVDSVGLTQDVEAVDWSYDDQYVACVRNDGYLYVYSFDGSSLSPVDNISMDGVTNTMRAHPSGYYFAAGTSWDNIEVFKLSGGSLSNIHHETIPSGGNIEAVDWSHDGNYLVASYKERTHVYSFISESLSSLDYLDHGADDVKKSALCWDQTGNYFAVGTEDSLRVLHFDAGGTDDITHKQQEQMAGGDDVDAVDWSKTGSWIAIGTAGTSNQLRVYEFNSATNVLTEKASITVGAAVKSVHWNSDVTELAVGKAVDGGGTELRVYGFDQETSTLSLNHEAEVSTQINSVRWRGDEAFIAYGDDADNLVVYSHDDGSASFLADSVFLDNTFISLNNDVSWKMSTTIQDECMVDGNGHIVTIEDTGTITVTSGAQLTFKNLELKGFSGNTLKCYSNDASIVFQNCTISLDHDFAFDTGSILFESDNIFTGTNKFIYSSSRTSTIESDSSIVFKYDTTFKYNPSVANRDLFYMTDNTSCLYLDSCTLHSTSTGIRLTRGTLLLDNLVTFSSEGSVLSESICFGNGEASENLTVVVLSGAGLDVYGEFEYDNVGA